MVCDEGSIEFLYGEGERLKIGVGEGVFLPKTLRVGKSSQRVETDGKGNSKLLKKLVVWIVDARVLFGWQLFKLFCVDARTFCSVPSHYIFISFTAPWSPWVPNFQPFNYRSKNPPWKLSSNSAARRVVGAYPTMEPIWRVGSGWFTLCAAKSRWNGFGRNPRNIRCFAYLPSLLNCLDVKLKMVPPWPRREPSEGIQVYAQNSWPSPSKKETAKRRALEIFCSGDCF